MLGCPTSLFLFNRRLILGVWTYFRILGFTIDMSRCCNFLDVIKIVVGYSRIFTSYRKDNDVDYKKFKKICCLIFMSYFFLLGTLFFLMGEQLHIRNSRGSTSATLADSATLELVRGNLVEQHFTTEIHRFQSISVQWGNYYRENRGIAVLELWDVQNNILLLTEEINMAEIQEGEYTTLSSSEPIEGIYGIPLSLKIYSYLGELGTSATPLMTSYRDESLPDTIGNLFLNGVETQGVLCFATSGEDYIWTGVHYWKFAMLGAGILIFGLYYAVVRVKQGEKSYLYHGLCAMEKYRFLMKQLIARDFRGKYKRSVLGVFWSFLNPLLTMIVQYTVFSELFRFDLPHYPVYLLCGIILFGFFTEACGMTLNSIVGNASLITKVYVPKYVYPLTRTVSSLVNLMISLIPLFGVALFSGLVPTKAYLLLPFVLICLTMFSLGIGLILCTMMVFFRDTQFLWGIFSMIWMYLTPIFYPADILPENVAWVLDVNPLYYFITFTRTLIMDGISPEPIVYVQCVMTSVVTLLLGFAIFKKNQDKFVLYI